MVYMTQHEPAPSEKTRILRPRGSGSQHGHDPVGDGKDFRLASAPKGRLRQLEDAVMRLLRDDELTAEVMARRLGLCGLAREQRKAIGQSLGLTVADVWFAEEKGFSLIRQLFSGGRAGGAALHPQLQAFAEQVRTAVNQAPRRDVVGLADFRWALASLLGTSPSLEEGIMLFFLDWCEITIEPYGQQVLVYRKQCLDSRAHFRRHLSRVELEWRRGLRGAALAKRCPFTLRGLNVTLGQALHLLELREEAGLAEAS